MFNAPRPFLPPGVVLEVIYPRIMECPTVSDSQWILTTLSASSPSVQVCGSNGLPTLAQVDALAMQDECVIGVVAVNATTLRDVDSATQQLVLNNIGSIFSCLS